MSVKLGALNEGHNRLSPPFFCGRTFGRFSYFKFGLIKDGGRDYIWGGM